MATVVPTAKNGINGTGDFLLNFRNANNTSPTTADPIMATYTPTIAAWPPNAAIIASADSQEWRI